MSAETRVVYWYACDCEYLSKYCDEHHRKSARVPVSYLEDPEAHDREVAERAWNAGYEAAQ